MRKLAARASEVPQRGAKEPSGALSPNQLLLAHAYSSVSSDAKVWWCHGCRGGNGNGPLRGIRMNLAQKQAAVDMGAGVYQLGVMVVVRRST
jgi:hypothetical protein